MNFDSVDYRQLSIAELETIEKACTRFEESWSKGDSPCIEDYLSLDNHSIHDELLCELLKLELDYRNSRGETVAIEEIHSRFPSNRAQILEAFGSFSDDPDNKFLPVRTLRLGSEFELQKFHARGGGGEIFVAEDCNLGRKVAVKFPRDNSPKSSSHRRLRHEAEITGRLRHPGIVPVIAVSSTEDQTPCYVMQFVEGQTFEKAIQSFHEKDFWGDSKFNSWDFRKLIQRLVSVCATVAYAHQQGVIHRDIKPNNIMLGSFGETILLDWGISKYVDSVVETETEFLTHTDEIGNDTAKNAGLSGETMPGQLIGTPEFASPEQVTGNIHKHGPRSDIYSLGATLYFLLVGRRAIEIEDLTNLTTASALRHIEPAIHVDSEVPNPLNLICRKALSFDPNDRYQQVADFADDLERYLADQPISIGTEKLSTRAFRWIRNHPRFAYGIGSGLCVAIIGLVISSWLLNDKAAELATALTAQKQTNRQLELAKNEAQENASDTLDALRTVSDTLVQQWFTKQKSLTEKDHEFMRDILSKYQEFARSQKGRFYSRRIEAEGYQRISQIQILLDQVDDAFISLKQAVDLLTPIPDDADDKTIKLKAICNFDVGRMLFRKGQIAEAIEEMENGIGTLQILSERFPDDPESWSLLGKAQSKLGATYISLKKSDKALQLFRESCESSKQLAEKFPDKPKYLYSYASKLTNIGVALSQKKMIEESIVEHEKSQEIHDRLDRKGVLFSDLFSADGNAINLLALARNYYRLENLDKALQVYELALVSSKKQVEIFPSFANSHNNLARSHQGLSTVNRKLGNLEEAANHSRLGIPAIIKAVEMNPNEYRFVNAKANLQLQYARALENLNKFEPATKEFEVAVQFFKDQFELFPRRSSLYSYANTICIWAELYRENGDDRKAESKYMQVIEILESAEEPDVGHPEVVELLEKVNSRLDELK